MPRARAKPQLKHEPYAKLRGKMKERNITQKGLAKFLGLSEITLGLKINGKQDFTVVESERICEYLHCNPSVFYSSKVCSYRNDISYVS
jgi:DNA-binding Xre family transcriptional regulator